MAYVPRAAEHGPPEVRTPWWLLVALGAIGIVAGVLLLAWPSIGLVTLAWISGIFLIVDGIYEFVAALGRRTEHRGMLVLLGVLSLVAGLFLVRHPVAGVVVFALLLGFWLIVFGAVRIVEAFGGAERRVWDIVIGVVEIAVGILIVAIPSIGVGTLAILVAIAFILRGIGEMTLGWALRKAP